MVNLHFCIDIIIVWILTHVNCYHLHFYSVTSIILVHPGPLNKGLKSKLQIVQNKIIRFIKSYSPRHSITWQDYVHLNMLNVSYRVKQLRLNHMHKIYYKTCPSYLRENFVNGSRASKPFNFILPSVYNTSCKRTFLYTGPRDWNSLPDNIKSVKNITRLTK